MCRFSLFLQIKTATNQYLSTGQKVIENILQLKPTQNWELDRFAFRF